MTEFLKTHQLNIMLFMSGMCGILALLSLISRVLTPKRRRILTLVECAAMLLLIADRFAYRFRGDPSELGFMMVRISNFLSFFLMLFMVHEVTLYLGDRFRNEAKMKTMPGRLRICEALYAAGTLTLVVSQFTGWYYFFDETNTYHRGPANILSFLFPAAIAILQLSAVIQHRKKLNRLIVISLVINAVVPLAASVIQIFTYGLSLVNMSFVGVAIVLYVFVVSDMNRTVQYSREMELEFYRREKQQKHTLFEQTAEALASAIDAKDRYTHGHSGRVAEYSRKIAQECGKSEEECDQIYFAAQLHDVGKIGIADSIISKEGKLTPEEYTAIKQHPVYGYQILSKIGASPYLSIGARYHHERYDGKGYPDGLVGQSIPEMARIIAVADAYDAMTSKCSYRDPIPQQKVREELVKGMGTQFDPVFAKAMIHLIDLDTDYHMQELENGTDSSFNTSLVCDTIGHVCTAGILMNDRISRIHLVCSPLDHNTPAESFPAAILYDSLNAHVPETASKKKELLYYEYAVLRFDGQIDARGARKTQVRLLPGYSFHTGEADNPAGTDSGIREYDLEAVRVRDHVQVRIDDGEQVREFTIALPDNSRFAYLSFTGQNCLFREFRNREDKNSVNEDYISRIADEINYIKGCPEGDLPNIQIDGWRTASTEGIPVDGNTGISFHTKSLPSARLVWHCPFICLFASADRKVNGRGYREFALIRLDGENWHTDDQVNNDTQVHMTDAFPGWDKWKSRQKDGIDCGIILRRENDSVILRTENLGISIHSVITIRGFSGDIYAALTGDQCAITEIQITGQGKKEQAHIPD